MSNVVIFIIMGVVFTIILGLFCGIIITETLCIYGRKQFIVTILIALVIGFGIGGLYTLQVITDKEMYNEGYCECGGEWELFDIEKGHKNGSTIYYYKCNDCKNVIETHTEFE